MAHFTYILKNNYGRHYVGHTQDLNARLREHNSGTVIATKKGRPWHIEWFCCFREAKNAIAFEKYLKSGSGVTFRQRHLIL
jgi:predicted GIY-YIG superfamily endonuclease